jgi:putative aldouronate transport system permease protein
MLRRKPFLLLAKEQWILWLMLIPGVLSLVLFSYLPMFGIVVAFQKFDIAKGFFGSPFIGLANFDRFLHDPMLGKIIRNTLGLSALKLVISFPIPIIFALLLNELRMRSYKRVVQTISYLPHFVSWVIVIGIFKKMLSAEDGIVNLAIERLGGDRINFAVSAWFMWPWAIFSDIWKETGWGAILYLAALTSIDPQLYEAATVDGAGRWKQMLHITLPGIKSTIIILLILAIPSIVSSNVEQMWVLGTLPVRDVTEVIDTYVLRTGLGSMQYSIGAAAGLVKTVISVALLVAVNTAAKRIGEQGVY